jgi:3-oxo-5-alpha-steroid 4-dehydrogenase 1
MGKTSTNSRFNLPGRYAWAVAEFVGPLNLLFIIFTLPSKLKPVPQSSSSFLGTGLPAQQEILGSLYVVHYINRAVVSPIFLSPSMSPIHLIISLIMMIFQFVNSSSIACWLVYSTLKTHHTPLMSLTSILGLVIFFAGMAGNIAAENSLFSLRRGAAKRKAKSEGKAAVTYDKVYAIPPAEGFFKHILYPHYISEWAEWTGYAILGWAYGLGFNSPALWFVLVEIATMLPRAVNGRKWYEKKFGKRAVGRRGGATPLSWL